MTVRESSLSALASRGMSTEALEPRALKRAKMRRSTVQELVWRLVEQPVWPQIAQIGHGGSYFEPQAFWQVGFVENASRMAQNILITDKIFYLS